MTGEMLIVFMCLLTVSVAFARMPSTQPQLCKTPNAAPPPFTQAGKDSSNMSIQKSARSACSKANS